MKKKTCYWFIKYKNILVYPSFEPTPPPKEIHRYYMQYVIEREDGALDLTATGPHIAVID